MSKKLMDKIKGKKVYETWKKGLSSWKEYRSVVRACREVPRKAKALLELKLARWRIKAKWCPDFQMVLVL